MGRVSTFYDEIGGYETFRRIVARVLRGGRRRPGAPRRCTRRRTSDRPRSGSGCFLVQYWGGPTTYSDTRGHPRLRMRHAPFAVTAGRQGALAHALPGRARRGGLTPEQDAQFWDYVTHAAQFMVNTFDDA